MKIKEGVKKFSEEAWVVWAVFTPDTEIAEVKDEFHSYYCAGPQFGKVPFIRKTETRILVTQFCGLDI